MKTLSKVVIVLLLAGAVAATLTLKSGQTVPDGDVETVAAEPGSISEAAAQIFPESAEPKMAKAEAVAPAAEGIPKLIDLGADKCIPCKMMAPILEELKAEYAGIMDVQFIDVWKNEAAGEAYGIKIIPTQIFYDAAGEERFRHVGFFSREDILAKWDDLGIDLGAPNDETTE